MNERFTIDDQPELFWVEGQLAEEDVLFIKETSGLGGVKQATGEILTPLRAKSRCSIGDPIVLPLAEYFQKRGHAVPVDIQLQMHHYEFYQVEFACSFLAAEGCRFHDASFGLNLKQSIGPEITFGFDPTSSSLKLPFNYERSKEYVTYQSRIVASGLRTSQPRWQFTRTGAHEIEGSQKLFMILRKPKGIHVNATFSLASNVQFTIAGLGLDLWPLVMIFRHRSNPNQPLTDAPSVPLDLLV